MNVLFNIYVRHPCSIAYGQIAVNLKHSTKHCIIVPQSSLVCLFPTDTCTMYKTIRSKFYNQTACLRVRHAQPDLKMLLK